MNSPADAAEQVHQSAWLDHAIRLGLVAYGVVHLLVAWLAVQLAFGEKQDSASNSGALHYLAEQPLGGERGQQPMNGGAGQPGFPDQFHQRGANRRPPDYA